MILLGNGLPAEGAARGLKPCEATRLLLDVEDVIDRWTRAHGEDERIVGVVMDSAVTMAGFDLTSADATTRFLFHLNRRSRGQDVFWAIIGHTPKHVAATVTMAAL